MSVGWWQCPIPGLSLSHNPVHTDGRGTFAKVIAELPAGESPLRISEIYWSESGEAVVRGLHFQLPPFSGRKIVFVTQGEIRDFVLDMRVGSPTFQQHHEVVLSRETGAILIPEGCAHGFEVITGPAIVTYAQEGFYNREADSGINIASTTIEIHASDPEISIRDSALSNLSEFQSPFIFSESINA